MAVQAQYPSPTFRVRNNVFEEFQQHRESISGNLLGGYHNYGGQQHIFNAAVFSEPESELTCNNISGSRKRNRDDHFNLPPQQQQEQPILLQHHQQQVPLRFQYPKAQILDQTQTGSASISTGLQLSLEEKRLHGSEGTSTSGRSSAISPFLVSSNAQDLNSYLLHQTLEIDALIVLQNEKLRSGLQETRKRHCRSLMSVLEQQVLKRLQEKETELANASRRNAELEEKVKQMSAENQIWFNVAKNNEAIVSTLKSSLEQILLQNQGQVKEGFGDSDDNIADDAQSCCNQGLVEEDKTSMSIAEKTIRENHELKRRTSCKVCRENEVSVLLLPCRHLCLCKNCESKLDKCPICNSMKNASLQIFIS